MTVVCDEVRPVGYRFEECGLPRGHRGKHDAGEPGPSERAQAIEDCVKVVERYFTRSVDHAQALIRAFRKLA